MNDVCQAKSVLQDDPTCMGVSTRRFKLVTASRVASLWLILSAHVHADTLLPDVIPDVVPAEQREALQAQAERTAQAMLNHLMLRLDEIDRVCDLSADQKRLLTIAAKGAMQHRLDEWLLAVTGMYVSTTVGDEQDDLADVVINPGVNLILMRDVDVLGGIQFRRMEDAIRLNRLQVRGRGAIRVKRAAGDARLLEVLVDAGGIQFGDAVANIKNVDPNAAPLLNVAEHVLWTATIDRVLSDLQKEKFAAEKAERAALPREWRHERVMIEFDAMLRLDSTQRPPLAERVAKFLEMSQIKRWLKRKQGFEDAALARMALRAIPSEDVKDVLSSRQLLQWQYLLREDLESR